MSEGRRRRHQTLGCRKGCRENVRVDGWTKREQRQEGKTIKSSSSSPPPQWADGFRLSSLMKNLGNSEDRASGRRERDASSLPRWALWPLSLAPPSAGSIKTRNHSQLSFASQLFFSLILFYFVLLRLPPPASLPDHESSSVSLKIRPTNKHFYTFISLLHFCYSLKVFFPSPSVP